MTYAISILILSLQLFSSAINSDANSHQQQSKKMQKSVQNKEGVFAFQKTEARILRHPFPACPTPFPKGFCLAGQSCPPPAVFPFHDSPSSPGHGIYIVWHHPGHPLQNWTMMPRHEASGTLPKTTCTTHNIDYAHAYADFAHAYAALQIMHNYT